MSGKIIESVMLVYVSIEGNGIGGNQGNNNKFYKLELYDDGTLVKTYGRIGTAGQELKSSGGKKELNTIRREKEKKGYKELKLETGSVSNTNESIKLNIEDIVLSQIEYKDEESKTLLKYLINQNIHNVISNTNITFDIKTGIFSTALGVVRKDEVLKAKKLLEDIKNLIHKYNNKITETTAAAADLKQFKQLNEDYFSIIPTKIQNLKEFYNLLITWEKIEAQEDICSSLLTSLEFIEKEKEKAIDSSKKESKIEKIFNTKIELIKDKKIIKHIQDYFEKSKNKNHGYTTSSSKVKNIYSINIDKEQKQFNPKKLNNVMELWHGTKVCNLLSILKSSLLLPKQSPGEVTGYMFGKGLYFSNQSSKSLNYCDGMYWNNKGKSKYIYMFLCSIAMGNYQVPKSSTGKTPDSGYDSYWAKPSVYGIMNDEMIVFNNEQIRLDYLLEIEI